MPGATGSHPDIPYGGGFLLWKEADEDLVIGADAHERDWPDDDSLWNLDSEPEDEPEPTDDIKLQPVRTYPQQEPENPNFFGDS